MMKALAKKYKLFIAVTLAVLVAGMTVLGLCNFNQAIDYKDGYEVRVSVEQKAGKSLEILETATEDYLAAKGIKVASYATQKLDDGKTIVYKFNKDVKINEDDLAAYIQAKLDADVSVTDITASAEYSQVEGYANFSAGWALLGLGIGIVAIFIYALVMEKLSGAVATAGVSILSALVFTAMTALTRIPAYPVFGATLCFATIVGAVLALSTVSKCKDEFKKTAAANPDVFAIADKVSKKELKTYIIAAIAVALAAVVLCVFFNAYMAIFGAQILLAGLVALVVAYFGAPLAWALVKGSKKKK